MSTQRIRTLYTVSLVLLDSLLIGLAFVLAYQLRVNIAWPEPLLNQVPLASYAGLFVIQLLSECFAPRGLLEHLRQLLLIERQLLGVLIDRA